jgi:hypothetical protein
MSQVKNSQSKTKYILIGLGVVALTGTALYLVTRRKSNEQFDVDNLPTSTPQTTVMPKVPAAPSLSPRYSPSAPSSPGFPLKVGSSGELVKNLQEALIKKYGASILPQWGADGQWGSELQNALIDKKLPTVIDSKQYEKMIAGNIGTNKFDPVGVTKYLFQAIAKKDFGKADRVLGWIHTKDGYRAVDNETRRILTAKGNNWGILESLFGRFTSKSQVKKLNAHFHRIGLRYDGSNWSLYGIDQPQLRSLCSTKVWNSNGQSIRVPENTILGEFVEAGNGITKFRTLDDKLLYASTKTLCYV